MGSASMYWTFIQKLGETLSEEEYEKRGRDIWVAKSAKVPPTAFLNVGNYWKDAEVRHMCFYSVESL